MSVEEDLDAAADGLVQWFRREEERIARAFLGLETPEDIAEREAEVEECQQLERERDAIMATLSVCGVCDEHPTVTYEDAGIDGGPSPVTVKAARITCMCGLEMRAPSDYPEPQRQLSRLRALVDRWNEVWKRCREREQQRQSYAIAAQRNKQ